MNAYTDMNTSVRATREVKQAETSHINMNPLLAEIMPPDAKFADYFRSVHDMAVVRNRYRVCIFCSIVSAMFDFWQPQGPFQEAVAAAFGPPPYLAEQLFTAGAFDAQLAACVGNVQLFKHIYDNAEPAEKRHAAIHSTANLECLEFVLKRDDISQYAMQLAEHASIYHSLPALHMLQDHKIAFDDTWWSHTAIRADDAKALEAILDKKEEHPGTLRVLIFHHKSTACFRLFLRRYTMKNASTAQDIIHSVLYQDSAEMLNVLVEQKLVANQNPSIGYVIRMQATKCLKRLLELGWTFSHEDVNIARYERRDYFPILAKYASAELLKFIDSIKK